MSLKLGGPCNICGKPQISRKNCTRSKKECPYGKDEMSVDITKLLELKDSIDLVKNRIKSDNEIVHKWMLELQKECPHLTIKTKRNYYEGGYDYVSSVNIVKTCTLCDKVISCEKDPNHKGHYD